MKFSLKNLLKPRKSLTMTVKVIFIESLCVWFYHHRCLVDLSPIPRGQAVTGSCCLLIPYHVSNEDPSNHESRDSVTLFLSSSWPQKKAASLFPNDMSKKLTVQLWNQNIFWPSFLFRISRAWGFLLNSTVCFFSEYVWCSIISTKISSWHFSGLHKLKSEGIKKNKQKTERALRAIKTGKIAIR